MKKEHRVRFTWVARMVCIDRKQLLRGEKFMNIGKDFGSHRHSPNVSVSKFKKPDNSELLLWMWLQSCIDFPRRPWKTPADWVAGNNRNVLFHSPGGQSQGPARSGCSKRESVPVPFTFWCELASLDYGHLALPSVFRVTIAVHLPLIRMHVVAVRTHLDNTGFSPHLKSLNHTCKGPLLVGLFFCHLR